MMQCTFELMSILGSLAFGDQSYGEGVFALLVEVYDGVQGCEDVVVGEGGLQLGGQFVEDYCVQVVGQGLVLLQEWVQLA